MVRLHSPLPFFYEKVCGSLAQLGEHLPYKQRVTGSSPVTPTICGLVVQLVRMPACHAGGRRFEPVPGRHFYAAVAQSVERILGKDEVGGSNPPSSSRKSLKSHDFGDFSCFFDQNGVGQNVGQLPDPHRDPHVEMCGKV